jgi:hypothetical protein
MSDTLKTTYRGIEIEYREGNDRWFFEIAGKEKSAESLTSAKQHINMGERQRKAPVEKFKAYQVSHRSDLPEVVEVGAQTERRYDRATYFWVTAEGKREKVNRSSLFKITEANDTTFAEIRRLDEEGKKIDKQIGELRKSLELIDLREEE